RSAFSTAVSASDTGVRSGFAVTCRSSARKRATDTESAVSASTCARARSSAYRAMGRSLRLSSVLVSVQRPPKRCAGCSPGRSRRRSGRGRARRAWHADYAALRRYLVDEHLLARERGEYRRTGGYVDVRTEG